MNDTWPDVDETLARSVAAIFLAEAHRTYTGHRAQSLAAEFLAESTSDHVAAECYTQARTHARARLLLLAAVQRARQRRSRDYAAAMKYLHDRADQDCPTCHAPPGKHQLSCPMRPGKGARLGATRQ